MRITRFFIGAVAIIAAGCTTGVIPPDISGGDGGVLSRCLDEELGDPVDLDQSVLKRARMTIHSATILDADANAAPVAVASMSLQDTTAGYLDSSTDSALVFSPTCLGLSGTPQVVCRPPQTSNCDPVPLDADSIVVRGGPLMQQSIERIETGVFRNTSLPQPTFDGSEVTVQVTGRDENGYFPSYAQALVPPEILVLAVPDPGAAVEATEALQIEWNAADGDHVEIALWQADNPSAVVICLVSDKGCHTIPTIALQWLRGAEENREVRLGVQRVTATVSAVDGVHSARFAASSEVQMPLMLR